ncbi:hypothetical protein [Microbacterium album]|uniref:Uncharacterized protein n=1 Tax=Microbacterium album TaxID=2053191 RepID=A0A917ID92_9MICO|nr:hypothetical protein [Microbacterium album]GGH33949.1 hypothetical protein GCM10010921_01270 [Microbacterium album]
MIAVRWAALVVAVACMAGALHAGVVNGFVLAGLVLLVVFVWPALPFVLWGVVADVVSPVCLDCRDGRHLACDGGCDCPVDHAIEQLIADVDARAAGGVR